MSKHNSTTPAHQSTSGITPGFPGSLVAWWPFKSRPSLNTLAAHNRVATALITGASSGIGATFAHKLAALGYHLILVARRADRLHTLAENLRQTYRVTVDIYVADLADPADLTRLEQYVRTLDTLEILVNNAGFGTTGRFAQIELSKQLDMIHVHILASVRLTHAALPGMLARQRGNIINVASITAYIIMPGTVTYCATKAYLTIFSEALQMELPDRRVQIQALCPGYTYTEFHDSPEYAAFKRGSLPEFLWMPAEAVVETSLKALSSGKVICIPGWQNRLLVTILRSRRLSKLVVQKRLRSKLRESPAPQPAD